MEEMNEWMELIALCSSSGSRAGFLITLRNAQQQQRGCLDGWKEMEGALKNIKSSKTNIPPPTTNTIVSSLLLMLYVTASVVLLLLMSPSCILHVM
jgi:hypothetical protein